MNGSNSTTASSVPTAAPSTAAPSRSPTVYTIYDLVIEFTVTVHNKDESDIVYREIKAYGFFSDFKQSLLDSLDSDFVRTHYNNASIAAYTAQIGSMQESPISDIGIVSPTHSPTNYPTYDYEAGEQYGMSMIVCGGVVIVGAALYAAYRKYANHRDYKREMKSAMPHASVELQSLFEHGNYKLAD